MLGSTEGFIDKDGSDDELGLIEGKNVEDGAVEGAADNDNDGCMLGSLDMLMYVQY